MESGACMPWQSRGPMTAEECNERGARCAQNASLAVSEPVRLEFLKLAAQWRAMANRLIFLGPLHAPVDPRSVLNGVSIEATAALPFD
jgi:hypothetical protein